MLEGIQEQTKQLAMENGKFKALLQMVYETVKPKHMSPTLRSSIKDALNLY